MEELPPPPGVADDAATMEADVLALRACARRVAAEEAARLRLVARLARQIGAEARARLAEGPRVPGQPSDLEVVVSAVTAEVMVVLGISEGVAQRLVGLAERLTTVLPDTLGALAAGRLDWARAAALAEATEVLDDAAARVVESRLLAGAGEAPWAGPSPRAWRAKLYRAVISADRDAARRRRLAAVAGRNVRAWPLGDGSGVLRLVAADYDIAMADRVVTDLALTWPATGPDGARLTMDQRRADALMDLFRRLHDGRDLPRLAGPGSSGADDDEGAPDGATDCASNGADVPAHPGALVPTRPAGQPGRRPLPRRRPDVGIVLHADTLFGDGPAAADPGELRGLGPPAPIDPVSAAGLARAELATGAGTRVLLVRGAGALFRVVPIGPAPAGGWTRPALADAVRAALPGLAPLRTDRYTPTAAIAEHVRTAQPRCGSYDCPRAADRCDLDHDVPWPRGPTDAVCMCPRCRRHHEHKTRGLVHTRLHPDGSLTTRMLTGLSVTTRPEPLPSYGLGEGYAVTPGTGTPDLPAA